MDGHARVLREWLTDAKKIEVPYFQRPYVWDTEDFDALVESFIDEPDGNMPFFGTVIMKQVGEKDEAHFYVIDGQQRLTTFNILIKVILDLYSEKKLSLSPVLFGVLRSSIYDIECDKSDREIFFNRMIPSQPDQEPFSKVMSYDLINDNSFLENLGNTPIELAYKYFYQYFDEDRLDIAKNFAYKLYHQNKSLIFIILDDKDDEQKIFDSVNSLGKTLSNSDIVKNYLFQKLKEYSNNDQPNNIGIIIDVYNKYWNSIFYTADKKDFWYKKFTAGRYTTDNLESFLRDFAVIKNIYGAKKSTGIYGLCNSYKTYINTLEYDSLLSFIVEISEYASVYYKYKLQYESTENYIISDSQNRILLILEYLETSTFNPYLLKLFKERPKDLDKKILNLEKFILQRLFYEGTTKNYNQCCEGLVNSTNDERFLENYSKESPVTNPTYKHKFRNFSNKQGLLIMFLIEMLNRKGDEDKYSDNLNIKRFTLEHIMPQKWHTNDDWIVLDSYKENPNYSEKDNKRYIKIKSNNFLELKDNRNNLVKSLGNFALLTSKLNTAISNGSIKTKMEGNGKKNGKGIIEYGKALSTTTDVIKIYKKIHRWDERNILEKEEEYFEKLNNFYHFE